MRLGYRRTRWPAENDILTLGAVGLAAPYWARMASPHDGCLEAAVSDGR